ncbi:MAG: hypothetical protein FJ390_02230 [Verrucomicrobia bacterium]|nr:hypothetical protein [Verrucomicrobiota bacterium]
MAASPQGLPTIYPFFNPAFSQLTETTFVLSNSPFSSAVVSAYATYGMNLNFIGAVMFPQVASTFIALQTSLLNVDASNPSALLQVQLTMSEYENAVQSTSQMYASMETLIKAIIQNV